jgi:hypothetical protein
MLQDYVINGFITLLRRGLSDKTFYNTYKWLQFPTQWCSNTICLLFTSVQLHNS